MQRAHYVVDLSAALQHHRLPVSADVADTVDLIFLPDQSPGMIELRQGVIAAGIPHHQLMAMIPRQPIEDLLLLHIKELL